MSLTGGVNDIDSCICYARGRVDKVERETLVVARDRYRRTEHNDVPLTLSSSSRSTSRFYE